MEDHLDTQIVHGLKDPWKFLFVDMDIAMLSVGVGFALLSAGLPTPLMLGGAAGVAYGLHLLRKGRAKGWGRHLRYWFFPPVFSALRRVPPMWAYRTVG